MNRYRAINILATVALPFSAALSIAQDVPDQSREIENRAVLEEVLVTARRTAENLQDVPVAISAMSGDDLRREQINSPTDLNGKVPSLVVGTGSQMRNTETPTIRGQGAQFGSSPGVIIYIAEVALPSDPVANYQGGEGKFFDLGNIQVLKGSQGTLFGRNTTGGALLLEPRRPENLWSASFRAGVNQMAEQDGVDPAGYSYEAVLNAPLIEDVLLARVGGQVFHRDGFTEDVVSGKDYDDKNYKVGRLSLVWTPTERLENYLLANYSESHTNGTATVIEKINREGLNQAIPAAIGLGGLTQPIPGLDLSQVAQPGCAVLNFYGPSQNCGQDILDEQAARGNRRVQLSADPNDDLESGTYVYKIVYDLTDELTLINIASYNTLVHSYRWDLDGSRASFNDFVNPESADEALIRTYTEELQLQGSILDGNLNFVVGAYYEETDAEGEIIGDNLFFVRVNQNYEQTKRSFAPFAQATYDLGHALESLVGLSLTAGVRRTEDTTSGFSAIRQVAADSFVLVDKTSSNVTEDEATTWTVGLDYKFDSHLVYGKVSRGYKTGGFSVIAVNPDHLTFEPEFVTNYELGHKSDFQLSQIPLRLNSAIYYTDYTDLQKAAPDAYVDPDNPSPVPQLGQGIFNVGKATVAGFEMDITAQLLEGLTLVATYGYTDAEYKEFELTYGGATAVLDCSGERKSRGSTLELSCVPYQTTPEHQYSVSARYRLPLDPTLGEVELSATYAWVDEQYSAQASPIEGQPGAILPSYGLINASASWNQVLGSPVSLQLYGTNLANKQYRISNSNQWNLTYFQSSIYSEPRNVGLQASYYWD